MKTCTRCHENKELLAFYKDAKGKQGRRSICKNCEATRHTKFAKNRWFKISSERTLDYWKFRANKLKQKAAGDITGEELQALYDKTKGTCVYCGECSTQNQFDHKIAICNGGLSSIDNIQILCPTCNRVKGCMNHEDFIILIKKIASNMR